MKENDEKQKTKQKNKKKPANKKQLNNKVLKAKEIIARNHEAMKKSAEAKPDQPELPRWKRVFRIVKRIFFWAMIVVLAVVLLSFIMIRIQGGTPTVFGYSVQRITTGSMEPTLMVGDIIISKEVSSPDDINIDDIVTFQGGSDFEYNKVTHRVVVPPTKDEFGNYFLITKGDANDRVDSEIYYSDVLSVMTTKMTFLNKFYDFFLSPWGLIIFIAALLIIFFDELLTLAKVLTGNYVEEEDENLGEIMDRIKQEEVEEQEKEEKLRERKRKHPKRFDNTSNKKKKKQKKNRKIEKNTN